MFVEHNSHNRISLAIPGKLMLRDAFIAIFASSEAVIAEVDGGVFSDPVTGSRDSFLPIRRDSCSMALIVTLPDGHTPFGICLTLNY